MGDKFLRYIQRSNNSESMGGVQVVDEKTQEVEYLPYYGTEYNQTGTLTAWRFADYTFAQKINPEFEHRLAFPQQRLELTHVTPKKWLTYEGFRGTRLMATGDDKEFGPGFYTMCAKAAEAGGDCYKLGQQWFTSKQENPRWSVVAFEVPPPVKRWFLLKAGGPHAATLLHYLTTPSGYPSGNGVPTQTDINEIEAINHRGYVVIFPDDPEQKISLGRGTKLCAEDVQYAQGVGIPADAWVVIGPQKPEYLSARQVVWRDGFGIWMINCAKRSVVFHNKL